MSRKARKSVSAVTSDSELFQSHSGRLRCIRRVLLLRPPLWTLAAVLFAGGVVARVICRHYGSRNGRIDMGREAIAQVPFYGLGLLVLLGQLLSPARTDAGPWWLLWRVIDWLAWFLAAFVCFVAIMDSMPP
jgi:hypothetical protein